MKLADRFKIRPSAPLRFSLTTPRNIVLFITSECNGSCSHCFVDNTIEDKINEQNLKVICESLRRPTTIVLTGGEPFLRSDLGLIAHTLAKARQVRALNIMTNGSFPDRIEEISKSIILAYKKKLHLQISLDGLTDTHDEIRKIRKGFEMALDVCRRAKILSLRYGHFTFIVQITIMEQNISGVEGLVDFLESKGYPSKLSIVRGNSFSTFNVPQNMQNLGYNPRKGVIPKTEEIEKIITRISKKHPGYFDSFQKRKLKVMLNTVATRLRQIPCYAGYEDGVIYNDGSVAVCEQVKPFTNLSGWGWNFLRAWNSEEAMNHRANLTSCACIHGCDISTSISMRRRYKTFAGSFISRLFRQAAF